MQIPYTSKNTVFFLATLSALALTVAIVSERNFGYKPCELCLVQRWWHCAVIVAALLASGLKRYRIMLAIQAVALAGCLAFSVYHVGVEHHLWQGTRACTIETESGGSVESLTQKLLQTPTVACDQPRWIVFGLSMAAYDAILTFMMLALALVTLARRR